MMLKRKPLHTTELPDFVDYLRKNKVQKPFYKGTILYIADNVLWADENGFFEMPDHLSWAVYCYRENIMLAEYVTFLNKIKAEKQVLKLKFNTGTSEIMFIYPNGEIEWRHFWSGLWHAAKWIWYTENGEFEVIDDV